METILIIIITWKLFYFFREERFMEKLYFDAGAPKEHIPLPRVIGLQGKVLQYGTLCGTGT